MATATREIVKLEQYLTFLLAGEEYAISILKVKEIIEYDTVTTVPKTPKWIRGVINLRGSVVPVVDLRIKFGLEERPVTKTTCIVIVEGTWGSGNTLMGVIADAVSQVMDIAPEDIQEVPSFGTRINVDYLLGMAQSGKKFVLLLDIDKILTADEVLDLSEAAANIENAEGDLALPGSPEAALTTEAGQLLTGSDNQAMQEE
ncbi:MAG TPA: chemotaxis protein CheW [Candidatus Saccharimonadales bacterium]|nr:chemotaxis protein CheW [Candidatus Saccharimonadales bacterium]